LFINGDAAMYMNSSASRAGILSGVKGNFEVGVSYLPYWPEAKGAPQNSIIGGATLWVLAGHDKSEYKAVAKFLSFMSSLRFRPTGTSSPVMCPSPMRPLS
jgi:sn-glycerol 3-phosphate transport system substrate-binding protein